MHLRKWLTNDRRLRAYLVEDGQAGSSGILTQALDSSTSSKVLGIQWDTMVDAFFFDPTAVIEAAEIERPTMRDVLRVSSRIFDPLGLIAPILLLLMIFKQIWEVCSGWDVSIPQNIPESSVLYL
jgi:Pao retrotransposon peptidase